MEDGNGESQEVHICCTFYVFRLIDVSCDAFLALRPEELLRYVAAKLIRRLSGPFFVEDVALTFARGGLLDSVWLQASTRDSLLEVRYMRTQRLCINRAIFSQWSPRKPSKRHAYAVHSKLKSICSRVKHTLSPNHLALPRPDPLSP